MKLLNNIEELYLDNYNIESEDDFKKLVDLFIYFKSLITLTFNNITINNYKKSIYNKYYNYLALILSNIPSLLILYINDNNSNEIISGEKIYQKIKDSIPKRIFYLKIFNYEEYNNPNPFSLLSI